MADEQQSELLALDATTCSIEELNKAALLIGNASYVLRSGNSKGFLIHQTPVSDSDWAAGFAMDALIHMSGDLYADTNGCSNGHLSAVMFYPIDLNATGRAAMCECIHRARLAHWQSEERK